MRRGRAARTSASSPTFPFKLAACSSSAKCAAVSPSSRSASTGCSEREKTSMKKRFQSMENILVIGGEDSLCYLVNIGLISENEPATDEFSPLARMVSLLRPNDEGLLEYNPRSNPTITRGLPSSGRVTSLAYMHEQGLIAIGMSNGVFCSVSLRSDAREVKKNDLLMLKRNYEIERLCVQRPSDDPQNCMYLWAQLRNEATIVLYLLRAVPQGDAGWAFSICFRHPLPNCDRFLLMRTVVLDKDQAMAIGSLRKADNEDLNASFAAREHDRFIQLMFFLYAEKHGPGSRLRGSVFDIDAYYSNQMPGKAAAHRKCPDQCGFLSHFAADSGFSDCNLSDIMDALWSQPPPPSPNLFPSALDFSLDVLAGSSVIQLNVSCLQDQVINDVSTNILTYYKRPGDITLFLHQIGLCNSVVQEDELMRVCLFRVLLHNFAGCERFLEMEEVTEEQLQFFRKWLGKEVEQTKKRFDKEACSIHVFFQAALLVKLPPEKVLRSTIDHVKHSQLVFRRASQLYERLITRFKELNVDKGEKKLGGVK
ncbi:hypothetical protein M3Y99_01303400 [Aphelenchoides fujianensis]|nr:hypothetical protein M3Y99_01303400 [Aphelenchoides fujianensis]